MIRAARHLMSFHFLSYKKDFANHKSSSPLGIAAMGLALFFCFAVTGCQTYEAQPLDPQATIHDFESRRLDDPNLKKLLEDHGLGKGPGAQDLWSLPSLAAIALELNPSVVRARAESQSVGTGVAVAKALKPLGVNYSLQYTSLANSPWTYGFSLNWLIETGGKRLLRGEQAEAKANRAALLLSQTEWEVRSSVLRSGFAILVDLEKSKIQASWEKTLESLVEAASSRLNSGSATGLELWEAERQLNQLRVASSDTQQHLAVSKALLAKAIGVPVETLEPMLLEPLPEQMPGLPVLYALRERASLARSDVLAALANYSAFETALHIEVAKQYPNLNLGPGYLFDQGQQRWGLGLNLSIPMNGNRASIKEARSLVEVAAAQFAELQANALSDVSRTWNSYAGALEKYGNAEQLVKITKTQQSAQERLFQSGATDRLSVLRAAIIKEQAEASFVDMRMTAWTNYLDLMDSVQGFLPPFNFTTIQ